MNEQLAGLSPDRRDALRLAGAVLFATGAFVLFARKSSQDEWAAFPLLLVLAAPCALLYGLGIGALRIGRDDHDAHTGRTSATATGVRAISPWRATALVLGLLLMPLALLQLVDTIGGDPNKSGWTALVFAITAGAAAYAAFVHGLRWGALFAGLALIVAWMAFWDAVADPSATAVRWLFIAIGVLLAVAAFRLGDDRDRLGTDHDRHDHDHAHDHHHDHGHGRARFRPELITAAGIAGIAAGVTALFALAGQFAGVAASAFGGSDDLSGTQQRQEWDVFLLVLAVALIWYGARAAWRGPVYAGAVALLAFIISASAEVSNLFSGDEPSGDVVGWPLLLLLLGGAALAAGLLAGNDRGGRGDTGPGGTTAVMPPSGGVTPDAPGGPASPGSPGTTPPPGSVPPPGSPPPGQP